MSTAIEYVEAHGLRFAYLSEGAGPLVLLLHGFPETAHMWDDLRPRLARRGYRAVSPFLRGYSPTSVPERDADGETLARDVLALIEALGEKDAIVVGHDWGALSAYGAASLSPRSVRKLFVVAIPHPATVRVTPRLLWRARHFVAYRLPGAAVRFARDDFAALREICRRWSPTWQPSEDDLAPARECFSHPESLDAAFGYYRALGVRAPRFLRKKIDVPTVAFAGWDDPLIDPSAYGRAARMFDKGYVIEHVPGGHFLHREHPELFAEKILSHL